MSKDLKVHLQVTEGRLRLFPKGKLKIPDVDLLLAAARSGLTIFPVIVIDLQELGEAAEGSLALLEEGLRQLIGEKKLTLSSEQPNLHWIVDKSVTSCPECPCRGNCQNCHCRAALDIDDPGLQAKAGRARK